MKFCAGCSRKFLSSDELLRHLNKTVMKEHDPDFYTSCPFRAQYLAATREATQNKAMLRVPRWKQEEKEHETQQGFVPLPLCKGLSRQGQLEFAESLMKDNAVFQATLNHRPQERLATQGADVEYDNMVKPTGNQRTPPANTNGACPQSKKTTEKSSAPTASKTKSKPKAPAQDETKLHGKLDGKREVSGKKACAIAIARAEGQSKIILRDHWALVPGMPN
eukprot:PhF_6_TR15465/c0_g1_i1/m.24043